MTQESWKFSAICVYAFINSGLSNNTEFNTTTYSMIAPDDALTEVLGDVVKTSEASLNNLSK